MIEPEWQALGHYIRCIADEIGLRDWQITLLRDPCKQDDDDGKVLAWINCIYGRRYATIRVCEDFRAQPIEDVRLYVIHELVHCHLDPAAQVIRCDLYAMKRLTESEYASIKASHHRAVECATDALAMALAKHLPLIEWRSAEERMADKVAAEETFGLASYG